MTDLSQYSDSDLAGIAGVSLPGSDTTLSVQNNNPGNMKQDGKFAAYDSPKAGLAAMEHDLTLKVSGQSPVMKSQYGEGYQPTLRNVISTWAPPSENNTDNYVKFVSQHSGLDPDQPLSVADVPKIMQPMIHMEGGEKASSYFGKLMGSVGDAIVPPAEAETAKSPFSDMSDDELAKIAGVKLSDGTPTSLINIAKAVDSAVPDNRVLADEPGYEYGGILPFKKNIATGEKSFAVPEMIRSPIRGLQDLENQAQNRSTDTSEDAVNAMMTMGAPFMRGAPSGIKTAVEATKLPAEALNKSGNIFKNNSGAAIMPPSLAKTAPSLLKMDESPSAPGSPPAAPLMVSPKSVEEAPSKLSDYLEADGIDLNKVADHLEALQKIDPNARAIDAIAHGEGDIPGGANILGLMKSISQTPGQARTMVAQLVGRGKGASADIAQEFKNSVSSAPFYKVQKDAIQGQEGSGPLYDQAYAANQNITSPTLNRILKTDAGKTALKYAAERMNAKMALMGVPDAELAKQATLAGQYSKGGIASGLKLQTFDYIKRGLQEQAQKAYASGDKGLATDITAQSKSLIKELDNLDSTKTDKSPGAYAQARANYATGEKVKDALTKGRDFLKMDKEEIENFMKDESVSNPEKSAFATGAVRSILDKLDSVQDGRNPVNQIWKANVRDRMRPLFPDQASFDRFSQVMDLHKTKMRVNQVMSGSPTFQNQAFDTQPVKSTVGHAIRLTADPLSATGNLLGGMADKALAKNAAKLSGDSKIMITRILTSKDPQALRAVAERINTKQKTH